MTALSDLNRSGLSMLNDMAETDAFTSLRADCDLIRADSMADLSASFDRLMAENAAQLAATTLNLENRA